MALSNKYTLKSNGYYFNFSKREILFSSSFKERGKEKERENKIILSYIDVVINEFRLKVCFC